MIFSGRVELLRRTASDDFGRRALARNLTNIKSLVLWGSLPVILSLVALAAIFALTLVSVQRGKIRVLDLLNLGDIVFWFVGTLLVLAFAALYLVLDLERCLRRLSALNEEEAISGNASSKRHVETTLTPEVVLEETDGLRSCLESALHDLDEHEATSDEDSADLPGAAETLPKRRRGDAAPLPEMLGETTRIDESTKPGDLSGIEGSLFEHPLSGEDSGLDEELLGGDSEGGSESTLKLP